MYKNILLKLSGEALSGEGKKGFSEDKAGYLVRETRPLMENGVAIGIVIGAGNIFRGKELEKMNGRNADQIGMLGTLMNSVYIKDAFEKAGVKCKIFSSSIEMQTVSNMKYDEVQDAFDAGKVVIFAGGTGNPFFTTDTAAALRAVEMNAQLLIKATKVDGIYSADPNEYSDAKKYDELTFEEAIRNNLKIMDTEAFSICRRYSLSVNVINYFEAGNLFKAVSGEKIGTFVKP